MGTFSETLLREFEIQQNKIKQADEIVLYGKTDVFPVMKEALRAGNLTAPCKVFDSGTFDDGTPLDSGLRRFVILCGMRAKTRESMKKGAALFFPDAPCCDYFAIYYDWLINKVKRECDREELAKTLLAVRDEQTIHNIDSISTSYCNLNCKECSNGMQYRKNKKRIPLERQAQSLNALTNFLPVSYCNMQGGEPLLDPELAERIRMHGNNPRIAFLTLATNGTLLPNDAVMQAMRDTGLMLRISDYGALSKMKLQIMHKAELFSVPCDVYHRAESWVSYGKLERRGRSHAQNRAAAESCHFGTKDLMVYDGYIYSCCRTLYADALGMDNEAVRSNRLCLTQPFSREELDAIVFGKSLYRMCDYCDAPMRVIPVAEQMPRG